MTIPYAISQGTANQRHALASTLAGLDLVSPDAASRSSPAGQRLGLQPLRRA
jgi:hypothetical protein